MANPDDPVQLTVRSGTDVVEVVPYLLGFRPHESLVVVLLKEGRVEVSARVDADPLDSDESVEAFVEWLHASMRRFDADDVVLVVWSARQFRRWGPSELAVRLDRALAFDPLDLIDTDGHTVRTHAGDLSLARAESRVAVSAIAAGIDPFVSRAALAARVEGEWGAAEREGLERRCRELRREVEALDDVGLRAGLARLLGGASLDEDDAARLGQYLRRPGVLEHLATTARRADARDLTERAVAAVRVSPGEHRWAPLVAVAFLAWLSGDGALASVCLEDLENLGHEHLEAPVADLARVVDTLVGGAIDPRGWNEVEPEVA